MHLDIEGVLEEGGKPFHYAIDKNGYRLALPIKKQRG
jgi:hypothetical protein